jgi:hypothetical protein
MKPTLDITIVAAVSAGLVLLAVLLIFMGTR